MKLDLKKECPICECETAHVNNHVRMSADGDHGPTQTYPDGWDPAKAAFADEGNAGSESDVELVDQEEPDDGTVPLEIDDRPSDFREYECPKDGCSETVEYLADECAAEHEQEWVVQ